MSSSKRPAEAPPTTASPSVSKKPAPVLSTSYSSSSSSSSSSSFPTVAERRTMLGAAEKKFLDSFNPSPLSPCDWMSLPTPFSLFVSVDSQDRFKKTDDRTRIEVMYRQFSKTMKDLLEAQLLKLRGIKSFSITSPQGIGKSHALAYVAAAWKAEGIPVVHVVDSQAWIDELGPGKMNEEQYLLDYAVKPAALAMGIDLEKETDLQQAMYKLGSGGKKVRVILDQYNRILAQKAIDADCRQIEKLANTLAKKSGDYNVECIILCLSANNSDADHKATINVGVVPFLENEFKKFVQARKPEMMDDPKMMDLLGTTTGLVPWEVAQFFEETSSFDEDGLHKWASERIDFIKNKHTFWFSTVAPHVVDDVRKGMRLFIARKPLVASEIPTNPTIDNRFLYKAPVSSTDHRIIIKAVSPLHRQALVSLYYPSDEKERMLYEEIARAILGKSDFTTAVQGSIAELVVINGILAKRSSPSTRKVKLTIVWKNSMKSKPKELDGKVTMIEYFSGARPKEPLINGSDATLFCPYFPNYIHIDFYLWIPSEKILLAVQVTLNIKDHPLASTSMDWVSHKKKLLGNGCDSVLKHPDGVKVYFIWCGPDYQRTNAMSRVKGGEGDGFLSFETLTKNFGITVLSQIVPEAGAGARARGRGGKSGKR